MSLEADHGPRPTLIRICVLAAAVAPLAVLSVVVALRAWHPFELEWMEGGLMEHAARVLAGQPLYVEPTLEFTPFIYGPAGYWAGAVSMALFGEGIPALRGVSVASTIVLILLIGAFVRRETGRIDAAVVAAGIFAATWEMTGAWLDLARVDALSLALTFASAIAIRASKSTARDVSAATLALLAVLVKQSAIPVLAALALWSILARRGWQRFAFSATLMAGLAVTTLIGDAWTDGWYSYYVFRLPSEHRIVTERIAGFWLDDMRLLLPALAAAFAVPFLLLANGRRRDAGYFVALLAGATAAAWAGRVHVGGWLNAGLPLAAAASMSAGSALPLIAAALSRRRERGRAAEAGGGRGAARSPLAEPVIAVVILSQFLLLANDPRPHLPTRADREAGEALVERLAGTDGGLFVPFHGYLALRAGKKSSAHAMALEDVFRGANEELRTRLRLDLSKALHDGRYGAVVLDRDRWGIARELTHLYDEAAPPFAREDVFWTVTGLRTRPRAFYVLRQPPRAPR